MCFNTTVSNAGHTNGGCASYRRNWERNFSVVGVKIIFSNSSCRLLSLFAWSNGPEKLFLMISTEQWGCIDQNRFSTAFHYKATARTVSRLGKTCNCLLENSCEISNRKTIRELLELVIIFFRGQPILAVRFMAPNVRHHVRWMAKHCEGEQGLATYIYLHISIAPGTTPRFPPQQQEMTWLSSRHSPLVSNKEV